MDADASGATQDYSSPTAATEAPPTLGIRSRLPLSSIGALRALFALIAVTGAFLLVLSTFTTVVGSAS